MKKAVTFAVFLLICTILKATIPYGGDSHHQNLAFGDFCVQVGNYAYYCSSGPYSDCLCKVLINPDGVLDNNEIVVHSNVDATSWGITDGSNIILFYDNDPISWVRYSPSGKKLSEGNLGISDIEAVCYANNMVYVFYDNIKYRAYKNYYFDDTFDSYNPRQGSIKITGNNIECATAICGWEDGSEPGIAIVGRNGSDEGAITICKTSTAARNYGHIQTSPSPYQDTIHTGDCDAWAVAFGSIDSSHPKWNIYVFGNDTDGFGDARRSNIVWEYLVSCFNYNLG